jgi:rSAM/selenodomain-associated transferase 2
VYNEEAIIGASITRLLERAAFNNEIIIVDGNSTDNTLKLAAGLKARVWASPKKGRAFQMHYGAKQATGDVFFFLHADSTPPQSFDSDIFQAISNGKDAGSFRMRFDDNALFFRFFSFFVRFNFSVCRGGDQGLFISRKCYEALGGFNVNFPIMEDVDFIKRIRRVASFCILKREVITSARKYHSVGKWKLQFIFAWVHFLYAFGVAPQKIYDKYHKVILKT